MPILPRPASPRALRADLAAFWAARSRRHWIAAVLAVLVPVVILVGFYFDAETNIQPGPRLTLINSWRADRSDAEIIAKQKADQRAREEALRARQREFQKIDQAMNRMGL